MLIPYTQSCINNLSTNNYYIIWHQNSIKYTINNNIISLSIGGNTNSITKNNNNTKTNHHTLSSITTNNNKLNN